MESKKNTRGQNNRYLKLSLKKTKLKNDEPQRLNRTSDVIILDETSDKLKLEFPKILHSKTKNYSPIVINDSSDASGDDLPRVAFTEKEPSKSGNVSFNCSKYSPSPNKEPRPSIGGWSPAQHIISAKPRNDPLPSTPKDVANESYEQCTMKTIEQSQKKILNDLYGDTWKSIPKLFKTISQRYENFDGVTKKLFNDDDKENIRHVLRKNKELYLTSSDVKRNETNFCDTEKKSKKKLYTEKVPSTPEVKYKTKVGNFNTTTKKNKIKKGMSVTELVEVMKDGDDKLNKVNLLMNRIENDLDFLKKQSNVDVRKGFDARMNEVDARKNEVDVQKKNNGNSSGKRKDSVEVLTKRIEHVSVTPKNDIKRLSFIGSLADNVPSWRCHPEAFQYRDSYKTLREQLARRLYTEFNRDVFGDAMDADMPIVWDSKLRSTAGTTTNRLIKTANGDRIRSSSIKLSTKVVDAPQRLRDTLIHELCHAATWLIDAELKAGHGPLWKKWATRALRVFPELGEISRCHDMEIHFKYSYKCTKCGYSIQRHSKSIDITKKCCGYCRGTFEIVVNKKNKDGVVVTTPARKGAPNGFAQYVKENYAGMKDASKTHAQVMKLLGEQFSARKKPAAELNV